MQTLESSDNKFGDSLAFDFNESHDQLKYNNIDNEDIEKDFKKLGKNRGGA